jgi:RNA recognition motif-containing protein
LFNFFMNLFVAKLSSSTTGEDLQELFSAHGEVTSAKVIVDRETGNSKGFGFVEMANDDEAKAAIAALNETELDGKEIVVKEANDREERPRSNSGQRSGGYQSRSGGGGGGYQGRSGGGGGGYQRRDDSRGGSGSGGGRRDDNRGGGGRREGGSGGGGNRW